MGMKLASKINEVIKVNDFKMNYDKMQEQAQTVPNFDMTIRHLKTKGEEGIFDLNVMGLFPLYLYYRHLDCTDIH